MVNREPNPKRLSEHEALREASGWYLAAWRDYRNLTLQDVADEVGTSRGVVSELETGKPKANGSKPLRYNRDWVDLMSKALQTTRGRLLDVNPFTADPDAMDVFNRVPKKDQAHVLRIVETFAKASADER